MMNRFKTMLFLLLFLVATSAQAQKKSLLWKITGKDLEAPSYLFGTIHIICNGDVLMTEAMKTAFAATDELVLEINMSDPSLAAEAAQLMMVPEGIDYKGKLSETAYNRMDELMTSSMGVGMQIGRMMKPIALMGIAYKGLVSCDQSTGMEEEFLSMVEETNKTVGGLETMAFQMGIFDDIPIDEQIQWIEEMLGNPEEAQVEFSKMMDAYKDQDVKGLYGLFKSSPEYEKYEQALLVDRNKSWIPQMAEMMKEKPTFFAVGAGHLGGTYGVIKLLKKEGYTVKAVDNR